MDIRTADRIVSARTTVLGNNRGTAVLAVYNCLRLAASPSFAMMVFRAGIEGRSLPEMLCSKTYNAGPLTGMVAMYVLMSIFHLPSWLRLIGRRRSCRA